MTNRQDVVATTTGVFTNFNTFLTLQRRPVDVATSELVKCLITRNAARVDVATETNV